MRGRKENQYLAHLVKDKEGKVARPRTIKEGKKVKLLSSLDFEGGQATEQAPSKRRDHSGVKEF